MKHTAWQLAEILQGLCVYVVKNHMCPGSAFEVSSATTFTQMHPDVHLKSVLLFSYAVTTTSVWVHASLHSHIELQDFSLTWLKVQYTNIL